VRIALAYNLRVTDDAAEATFATLETVESVTRSISRGGHDVVPVEVSVPVDELAERLAAEQPDLVFNLAEGWPDGARQPFFTSMYTQLGLAFTGSGPYAQAIALDKHLTKLVVAGAGLRTPRWQFVRDAGELAAVTVALPAIVKPNFEGTSRGITQASVVTTRGDALARATELLAQYPDGVLIEEYVPGRELTVPYLAGAAAEFGGALVPTEITLAADTADRAYNILDYAVKHGQNQALATPVPTVSFATPAALPEGIERAARAMSLRAVRAVGCVDIARVDFRLGEDGELYLIEVNALPGLDPNVSIHRAAALAGLHPTDGVAQAVIASAASRFGLAAAARLERR
jgi:D-alanine--D-alanine ligase